MHPSLKGMVCRNPDRLKLVLLLKPILACQMIPGELESTEMEEGSTAVVLLHEFSSSLWDESGHATD